MSEVTERLEPSPPFRGEREGAHRASDGKGEVGSQAEAELDIAALAAAIIKRRKIGVRLGLPSSGTNGSKQLAKPLGNYGDIILNSASCA